VHRGQREEVRAGAAVGVGGDVGGDRAGAIICGALMRSGPLPRPAQQPQPGAAWDTPSTTAQS